MTQAVVLPRETLFHVAARFIARSPYSSIALYAQAIVTVNPQVDDWTALVPGTVVNLP